MTCPLCFCFKRNRASYNISSENIFYTDASSIIPTVTLPPVQLLSDLPMKPNHESVIKLSDDGHFDKSNEQLIPTTAIEYNPYAKIEPRQSSQAVFNDDIELYAIVDKTRRARNAIRIRPDTYFPPSMTTGSSQPTSFSNSRVFRHRPRSLPPDAHVPMGMRINTHDDSSDRYRPRYDELKLRKLSSQRDQRFKIEAGQIRPHSFVYGERDTSESSDLYAEIGNGSASGTIYSNRQRSSSAEIYDNISDGYATIEELNITKKRLTRKSLFRRH